MISGITERERRAVEMRRIAWLAGAPLGSARMGEPPAVPSTPGWLRSCLPAGLWRRGLSFARGLGQRIDLPLFAPSAGRATRAAPLTR